MHKQIYSQELYRRRQIMNVLLSVGLVLLTTLIMRIVLMENSYGNFAAALLVWIAGVVLSTNALIGSLTELAYNPFAFYRIAVLVALVTAILVALADSAEKHNFWLGSQYVVTGAILMWKMWSSGIASLALFLLMLVLAAFFGYLMGELEKGSKSGRRVAVFSNFVAYAMASAVGGTLSAFVREAWSWSTFWVVITGFFAIYVGAEIFYWAKDKSYPERSRPSELYP